MFPRAARSALLVVAALAARPALAGGWQEVHQSSEDVRIAVEPDGVATVRHQLKFRVVAGRFKTLELAGLELHGESPSEVVVTTEKGTQLPARVEPGKTPTAPQLVFDDARGVARGTYGVELTYRLDLVAARMLTRDGALWKITWMAPPAPEGYDGARVVFAVPAAPTEPRLAVSEASATTIATLRRSPERDELELVRAHISRGEASTWAARIDPKALARVTSPELRPQPPTAPASPGPWSQAQVEALLAALGLSALFGLLGALHRAKSEATRKACARVSASPRPLVELPWGLASIAYGAAATGALVLLLGAAPTVGALLVVVAMALATQRAPSVPARPRGPGIWRTASDADVLVARAAHASGGAGSALDAGTWSGRLLLGLVVVVVAALAYALRVRVPGIGMALPLVATALVPLFITGGLAQLPRSQALLAARFLGPARDALGKLVDLAHVELRTIARFWDRGDATAPARGQGAGKAAFDEVRLSCVPADRTPGLRAIELALAPACPRAHAAMPEVLVRFDDRSAAAERIARIAPGLRIVAGRTPEEKVLRLVPHAPTPAGAARLVARLLGELEGRRVADRANTSSAPEAALPPYKGPERRGAKPAASRRPARAPVALASAAGVTNPAAPCRQAPAGGPAALATL